MFLPDIEALLRRPQIERPHEEFQLLPPELAPPPPGDAPETESPPSTEEDPATRLFEEAARVQELIDLIVETAPDVFVPVPEDEQELLGRRVTAAEYVESLKRTDPTARRRQDRFERGLLNQSGCGTGQGAWPLLTLPDLSRQRDSLLVTSQSLDGRIMADLGLARQTETARRYAVSGKAAADALSPIWGTDHALKHAARLSERMISSSRTYRFQLAGSVFTFSVDLRSQLLACMLEPLVAPEAARLRQQLSQTNQVLRQLRDVLCLAQTFRLLEFAQYREALQSLLKQMVLEQLLQVLAGLLSRAQQALISPLLSLFQSDAPGHPQGFTTCLTDTVGQAVGQVVAQAAYSLSRHYSDLLGDLVRTINKEHQLRLQKLQVLTERNVIGRWIDHLDQAIQMVEYFSQQVNTTQLVATEVQQFLQRTLPPTPSKLFDRLRVHPEYEAQAHQPPPGIRELRE